MVKLLRQQFERILVNPGDRRLLRQLCVEVGVRGFGDSVAAVQEWRVVVASVLYRLILECIKPRSAEVAYAEGVLSALLDVAAAKEEEIRHRIALEDEPDPWPGGFAP